MLGFLRPLGFYSLALLVCMLLPYSANAADAAGVVEQIKGVVKISGKDAKKGAELKLSDEITTGADGEVLIRMTDATVLSVRPNSQLKLEGYSFKADDKNSAEDNFLLKVLKGGLRTVTGKIGKRSPQQFKVSTVTAVVGIRGTDFEIAVVDDQAKAEPGTYNKVYDGRTFMQNNEGKSVEVGANQAAFAPLNALKAAQQFGILSNVPPVFFDGTFDGLMNGLQELGWRQLESKTGVRMPDNVKKLVPKIGDFFKGEE